MFFTWGKCHPRHPGEKSRGLASVIIRFFASKSLSHMVFGVPRLRKALISIACLCLAGVFLVSCGSVNSNPTTNNNQPSGLKFRAFISNPVEASFSSDFPALNIVDATQDLLSASVVNLSGITSDPTFMVESPTYGLTLVFSPADKVLTVVNNANESAASSGKVTLPGETESIAIDPFSTFAYAAVPTAPVAGQQPGAVVVLALTKTSVRVVATIPVPGAHYVVDSPDGLHLLVFADDSNSVTVITPILIGTGTDPRMVVSTGFDRPVWGLFSSDGTTAYILNCGAQCGGSVASVVSMAVSSGTISATVPVDAATIGLIQGTTLYVAGTPPGADCGGTTTAATTCGRLDTIDLNSMTMTGSAVVTDGYHNRIAMGASNQVFLGAHTCTNVNTSTETRGCLSIFQTGTSKVVIPPAVGDVTGIQPITNRTVVYVCQNGKLRIYDTTTDKLQTTQVNIAGAATDVKLADGPP